MTLFKKLFFTVGWIIIGALIVLATWGSHSSTPPVYGASFSKFHSDELGLDWRTTFLAVVNDLGVRHFRFSAHWPLTEPQKDKYNFSELDFQMSTTRAVGATVVLAVGRRLPGWPECHVPDWAKQLSPEKQQEALLNYIKTVVNRYKKYDNISAWQVENEPYLTFFSRSACGSLDEKFFERELRLVRELDPNRPILITDSGEIGTWLPAYQHGDIFGTSMYLYIWNHQIGPFRYPLSPAFFRIKKNIIQLLGGKKESVVIELSAEPWLIQPLVDTPINTQLQRMGPDKLKEVLAFSRASGFHTFYLWGVEWWYWLKLHGHSELWNFGKTLFRP